MSPARRLCLVLVGLVLVDQAVLHTVLGDGVLLGQLVAPFDPPVFTARQREVVERVVAEAEGRLEEPSLFDAELGWAPPRGGESGPYVYDWAGCRVGARELPRERTGGVRRILAVGGSFTQGAEVAGDESWVARVEARHPELEVANHGMGGYGLDQILLRYRREGRELVGVAGDEVWLGLMPEATLRLTTHYAPALQRWSSVATFKPLFWLTEEGELELVPNPARDVATLARLLTDQEAFFAATRETDWWVRRTPAAFRPAWSHPAHWSALGRIGLTLVEHGGRDHAAMLRERGHPLRRLAVAIVRELAREVEAAGMRLRVVVLPSRIDLARAADGPFWAELVSELRELGLDCLDAGDALAEAGALADDGFWQPGGHYSPEGNRVVAELVEAAWLDGADAAARGSLDEH